MVQTAQANAAAVFNRTRGTVLCERLEVAASQVEQSRGLLGRDRLDPGSGMLFEGSLLPLMWMHMFFMRFAIDIVFLDKAGRVLRINPDLRPWRVSSMVFGARRALELEAGAAARSGTMEGDQLEIAAAS
ncbi:MAG TPA: DUF192 domain-containing protein [Candidatus Binataceae bacterium]|nr:DUF192 domain-containing protein [Candidatus Binataceae bacterium]